MAAKNAKSDRPRDSMGRFRSKASEARSRAARRNWPSVNMYAEYPLPPLCHHSRFLLAFW